MKLYKVCNYVDGGVSGGFRWSASLAEAKKWRAEHHRNNPDRGRDSVIEIVEFEPTKSGILHLLRLNAEHADNG
jgi:hypothetical protein